MFLFVLLRVLLVVEPQPMLPEVAAAYEGGHLCLVQDRYGQGDGVFERKPQVRF